MGDGRDSTAAFERLLGQAPRETYLLRLYVAGVTPRSSAALGRIKSVCEEHLPGRYELEVIDIHQQPHLAREDQIVVTPTLTRVRPPPRRQLVGDLSELDHVCRALNIRWRD